MTPSRQARKNIWYSGSRIFGFIPIKWLALNNAITGSIFPKPASSLATIDAVRVGITFQRNQLELDVSDDGPATGPSAVTEGAGHGLIGMRERATVFGGTITAGTSSAGGWTVHARLPVPVGSV